MSASESRDALWPPLPLTAWRDTCATLHMWTQIVGKIRLTQTTWTNHSWHVTLYVTSTGLTTSPIPYGTRTFEIAFDFVAHELRIRTSDGGHGRVPLEPQSVATFYRRLMEVMTALGLPVRIYAKPNEVADAIPFAEDEVHRAYDRDYANRFWRVLVQTERVMKRFRARFIGKCSPVHFFWGGPDLAVTRFSGRRAPTHPGGVPNLPDRVAREAYSHEVSSLGFWPGGGAIDYPAFYAYAYPEPDGFRERAVRPDAAYYYADGGQFLLPYEAVRTAEDPDATLLAFLEDTYAAAADLGGWDRKALDYVPVEG